MPTFQELYPQFYTDEYQNFGPERPPDPSPDVSPISQYAAPMQAQQSMAQMAPPQQAPMSFSQRFHAVHAGQNPYDIQSQMENRKAQREEAKARQQAIDMQTEALLFDKIEKAEPGQRQPYTKALQRWYKAKGIEVDPGYMDVWNKAEADELEIYKQAAQDFLRQQAIDNKWTEEELQEKSKTALASPVAFARIHAEATKINKMRAEAKAKEAESSMLSGMGEALKKIDEPSGSPTSPQSAPPSAIPRPAPMTQPGGSQGPSSGTPALRPANAAPPEYLLTPEGQKVQQFVVQRAKALGVDPAYAQALIDQESGWNPQAVSPTGVTGIAQVTNKTGARYGQSPDTRTNPIISANTGLTHFADLLKETGGNYQESLRRYNGGSDPNYVQNVERHLPKYGGLAKPSTQSVAEGASDEDRVAIQGYNKEIQKLEKALKIMRAGATNENVGRAMVRFEKQLEDYRKAKQDIEKRYEWNPSENVKEAIEELYPGRPPTSLTKEERAAATAYAPERKATIKANEARAEAQATEASKIKVSGAQGLEAVMRQPISDTDRKNLRVYDKEKDDWVKVPVNWNQRKLQESQAEIRHMVPVEGKDSDGYKNLAAAQAAANNILPELDKPEVQKEIGNIFSNPTAWLNRVKAKTGKDLPESVYKLKSELSRLQATLQRYYAGTAQTATELKTLDPFIVHLTDPTPLNAKTKLKALIDGVNMEYDTKRSFDLDNGAYVPKIKNIKPAEPEAEAKPEGAIDKLKKLWGSK